MSLLSSSSVASSAAGAVRKKVTSLMNIKITGVIPKLDLLNSVDPENFYLQPSDPEVYLHLAATRHIKLLVTTADKRSSLRL